MAAITAEQLDELVDTDPIRLKDEAIRLLAEVKQLRGYRAELISLHEREELIFGGFICLHCTPDDADDPDDNVYWPCPSLRAVGVTDEEAIALITAHRAAIEEKARRDAEAAKDGGEHRG
ncbi:hypothetical protein [Streptosporangium sp. NPDC049078]|uniref:hypothetical protein n=1 Tax=Streptosporangium sp. NPDC049078 TaxID=3155767 RepID=UPI003412182E